MLKILLSCLITVSCWTSPSLHAAQENPLVVSLEDLEAIQVAMEAQHLRGHPSNCAGTAIHTLFQLHKPKSFAYRYLSSEETLYWRDRFCSEDFELKSMHTRLFKKTMAELKEPHFICFYNVGSNPQFASFAHIVLLFPELDRMISKKSHHQEDPPQLLQPSIPGVWAQESLNYGSFSVHKIHPAFFESADELLKLHAEPFSQLEELFLKLDPTAEIPPEFDTKPLELIRCSLRDHLDLLSQS